MKRIGPVALLSLLCCGLAHAQAGTPYQMGPWLLLNEAADVHPADNACYNASQVAVAAKNLRITMVAGSPICGQTNSQSGTFSGTQNYLSGSLITKTLNWKPTAGHNIVIEVKAKMSRGWAAIWLLGAACQTTSTLTWDNLAPCNWSQDAGGADSGEIDIAENKPNNYVEMSHNKFVNGGSDACSSAGLSDVTANFHTYHLDWSTSVVNVSTDGDNACHYTTNIPVNPMFPIIETRQQNGGLDNGFAAQPVLTVQYFQVCDAGSGTTCSTPGVNAGNTIFFDDFSTYAPVVDFTDLTSGPAVGGENNNGTILTLYGRNFGAAQGPSTVSVGGHNVAAYLQWAGTSKAATPAAQLQEISVAIGSGATTGTVAVTTPAGASSCMDTKDACQFTVRTGNIRCVATTGNDANNGNFPSSCWRTIPNAKNTIGPGDIAYIQNGVSQTTVDDFAAGLAIGGNNCTIPAPCALVAYPGATVTMGTPSLSFGIRTPAISGVKDNWVIAGFNISAQDGLDLVGVSGWRVINNDFNCPTGGGQTACMHTDTVTQYRFYGNYTHNVGDQAGIIDKFYHGNYFTTNTNHVWVGWNEVNSNPTGSTTSGGCRAMQFFSTGGADQFDLHVHDNVLHNSICDGLNFATVNPDSGGAVEAFNNIIYHVGTGPDPGNGASDYACLVAGGGGTGAVTVYNNTMYDCGGRKAADSGVVFVARPLSMWNNAIQQLTGELFLTSSSVAGSLNGSNDIWSGVAGAPSQTIGNLTSVPAFTSAGSDFTLTQGSPAIGAATASHQSPSDFNGLFRPAPPSIGAFEFTAGLAAPSAPIVSLSPSAVPFGNQVITTTSASQSVTLTNTGNASLVISSITLTGTNLADFSIFSNTCGASLGAGSNCVVSIRFTPSAIGSRLASLTFTTSAGSSPDNASLTGTGIQTDIYLAQTAAGSGLGTSCATAKAVSFFNASVNWGTNPGQIASGDTLHLCGTISTALLAPTSQGNGLITVIWETGAKLSAAANSSFLNIAGSTNQWKFNGGFPCGPQVGGTVTCNGIIENTANGTDRANQVFPVKAFELSSVTGAIEITGLDIRNLYVHTPPINLTSLSSNGTTQVTATCATTCGKVPGETGLSIQGTTNYNANRNATVTSTSGTSIVFTYPTTVSAAPESAGEIDDNIVDNTSVNCLSSSANLASLSWHDGDCHDVSWAAPMNPVTGSAGAIIDFSHLDIFDIDHGPTLGGTNTNGSTTFKLHDSHIHSFANWDTGIINAYHHDGFHFFNSQTQAAEVDIYNNLFDGWDGTNNTAPMFNQQSLSNTKIFNNVVVCSVAQGCLNAPLTLHEGGGGPNELMANNTFIETGLTRLTPPNNQSNNSCIQHVVTSGNTSSNASQLNNIFTSCTNMVSTLDTVPAANSATSGYDWNIYANRIADGNPEWNWQKTLSGISTNGTATGTMTCNVTCGFSAGLALVVSSATLSAHNATVTVVSTSGNSMTVTYPGSVAVGNSTFAKIGQNTNTFATWLSSSSEGPHSQNIASAGLDANGVPLAGSAAIGTGTNLTALCIGNLVALCSDTSAGNSRTPVARPLSGAWNIGALGVAPTGTPLASLSIISTAFFNQMVGTTTAIPLVATLANNGTATLNISSIAFTGTNAADFGQSNNCGAGLGAGNSCLITITFSPSAIGPRSAALNVNDNASGSPQTVSLTGNGMKTISGTGTITGSGTITIH